MLMVSIYIGYFFLYWVLFFIIFHFSRLLFVLSYSVMWILVSPVKSILYKKSRSCGLDVKCLQYTHMFKVLVPRGGHCLGRIWNPQQVEACGGCMSLGVSVEITLSGSIALPPVRGCPTIRQTPGPAHCAFPACCHILTEDRLHSFGTLSQSKPLLF